MATVCKRVTYSGRVQGVGFRYTARQLAAGLPVTGYVRNLGNGDVELVAEGESAAVEAFLSAVAERMRGYVKGIDVQAERPAGCSAFEIRH
jgi:acylphosphatase